jgi:hypothetical protein
MRRIYLIIKGDESIFFLERAKGYVMLQEESALQLNNVFLRGPVWVP